MGWFTDVINVWFAVYLISLWRMLFLITRQGRYESNRSNYYEINRLCLHQAKKQGLYIIVRLVGMYITIHYITINI